MLVHDALIEDIDSCTPIEGECAFWWLGQHSFIVKLAGKVLYIDPFLSDEPDRLIPPLLNATEVTNANLVFGTHDHGDHIDHPAWPDIAKASSDAIFVVPELVKEDLSSSLNINAERFVGLDDGRQVEVNGVKITGIAAAHEFLDRDEATGRYPYLGYVVEAEGLTVYHSGDTCIYEGLISKLRHWKLDIAFLPINGRDAVRLSAGCIGNMTYQEAADLAGELHPRLTVPAHFGMFGWNTVDPYLFTDYVKTKYPDLDTRLCETGKGYIFRGA